MYINSLPSRVAESSRIPMYFETDREAIQAAIMLSGKRDPTQLRMARISNTMQLEQILLSEALLEEAQCQGLQIIGPAEPMRFDRAGNLLTS